MTEHKCRTVVSRGSRSAVGHPCTKNPSGPSTIPSAQGWVDDEEYHCLCCRGRQVSQCPWMDRTSTRLAVCQLRRDS